MPGDSCSAPARQCTVRETMTSILFMMRTIISSPLRDSPKGRLKTSIPAPITPSRPSPVCAGDLLALCGNQVSAFASDWLNSPHRPPLRYCLALCGQSAVAGDLFMKLACCCLRHVAFRRRWAAFTSKSSQARKHCRHSLRCSGASPTCA